VGRYAYALAALRAKHPDEFAQIRGIGLSGQMHGAVLLDAQDRVLRPAILWNDMRSDKECADDRARAGVAQRGRQSRHARFHRAEVAVGRAPRTRDFCANRLRVAAKDYLRLQLTGGKVSDPSDAPARCGSTSPNATGPIHCSPPAT
jgi:Sugar (pentulose and hexulose) kinases